MSKDWTPTELQAASEAMKTAGHMSYEEFCEELKSKPLVVVANGSDSRTDEL